MTSKVLVKKAHTAIAKEIKADRMPHASTLKCQQCPGQAYHYHHEDYTKPLEVIPLCRSCHRRIHGNTHKQKTRTLVKNEMVASEWSGLSTMAQIEKARVDGPITVTWYKLPRLLVQHLEGDGLYEILPPGTGERIAELECRLAEGDDETDA